MPRPPSCICGDCSLCRNREAQRVRRGREGRAAPGLVPALASYCRDVPDANAALAELSGLDPERVSQIRSRGTSDELELDALCLAIGTLPDLLYLYA